MAKLFIMNYGSYTNKNAVENVIRYVTRTRLNEDRYKELIDWGSFNTYIYDDNWNKNPEMVIKQFIDVQNFYEIKKRRGLRIHHETFNLLDEEYEAITDVDPLLTSLMISCCRYYDDLGFQVLYAVHNSKNKGVHIHFVVNGISYRTGCKWHSWGHEDRMRENVFNGFLQDYVIKCMAMQK